MNRKQRRLEAKRERQLLGGRSAPNASAAAWNLALQYHEAGDLREAERLYRQITEARPDYVDAHANLGLVLHAQGRFEDAAARYRVALGLKDDYAEVHSNLGNSLCELGRFEEAVAAYRAAVAIKPHLAETHSNLGNALRALGDLEAALGAHRQAIALKPHHAGMHRNLGLALSDSGAVEDAVACFERALALDPGLARAHADLGDTLKNMGDLDGAIDSCRRALAIDPGLIQGHSGLGNALLEQGRHEQAIAAFETALARRPDDARVHNNLGNAFEVSGQLEEAAASFETAIALDPKQAEARNNLGNLWRHQGRLEEALASYRQAAALRPDDININSNVLMTLQYMPSRSPESATQTAFEWARRIEARAAAGGREAARATAPDPERRLRVGYVSADLHTHPVGLFLEPVLAAHDAERVEVFCYANQTKADDVTGRLRHHAQHWRSIIGLSDEAAAKLVRDDAIDILVDLSGHTRNHRLGLFALKPAPLQVTWLGYFATTGLEAMDYILADRHVIPPGEERLYSEKVLRLPGSYLCFAPPAFDVPVAPLAAKADDRITFGCFNSLAKVTPEVVKLWAEIMLAVPGSRLLLKTKFLDCASPRERLAGLFREQGVADTRLIFEGPSPRQALLDSYNRVDIALDPFPFNGGITSAEALWMSVPVVTLSADRFTGHVGESVLNAVGLSRLVARSQADYRAVAVELASDLDALSDLREGLRGQVLASPLCDGAAFTRGLEAAFRGIWHDRCLVRGEAA